jgi:hypothetical protein
MSEPLYDVLSPEGEEIDEARAAGAAPVAALGGRTVGLFWNGFTNGNLFLESLAAILSRRFPGARFVRLPGGRGIDWGQYPDRTLTDIVREYGIDAAIAGPGC